MADAQCHVLDTSGADPHGEAAFLRAQGPAAPVELPGGIVAWSVTRHDLIKRLAGDRRVSRDPRRHWPAFSGLPADWPLHVWVSPPSAFNAYGSEHRRLRTILARSFTPRRTEALRPGVQAVVARQLGALEALDAAAPGRVVDLRSRFAHMIPTEVICDLFGVPDGMRDDARQAIHRALNTAAAPEAARANLTALLSCLSALVAVKRAEPGEDMTSDLIAAREEERLDEEQLVPTLLLMIGAGSQTTVNLIAQAALKLLTHPAQLARLRSGALAWDDVIEETLRAEGPVRNMPLRYAVDEIDLDGVTIRQGDPILLDFGAAGRDPALHGETADVFDAGREDKSHLAFGHGAHYCLGAALARMEAGLALPALFDRFPGLRLAVPEGSLRPQQSFVANGHQELPVVLRPVPVDDAG